MCSIESIDIKTENNNDVLCDTMFIKIKDIDKVFKLEMDTRMVRYINYRMSKITSEYNYITYGKPIYSILHYELYLMSNNLYAKKGKTVIIIDIKDFIKAISNVDIRIPSLSSKNLIEINSVGMPYVGYNKRIYVDGDNSNITDVNYIYNLVDGTLYIKKHDNDTYYKYIGEFSVNVY